MNEIAKEVEKLMKKYGGTDFDNLVCLIEKERDERRKFVGMVEDDNFKRNRKSFEVAKYALADVIEALSNDQENHVRIVVTKEDGSLVVMFNRRPIVYDRNCNSMTVPGK